MDLRVYLKNLPSGTKLYSLVSGEVTFKEIRGVTIVVLDHNHCEQLYHSTGKLWNSGLDGECLLFPSKELRDWDLFTKFKKGDIVRAGECIAVVDHVGDFAGICDTVYYQAIIRYNNELKVTVSVGIGGTNCCRLASNQDREKILSKLAEAGYELKGDTIVKKRFDPKTLEGFQKVLVRSSLTNNWRCTFFSHMTGDTAVCSGDNWPYCIPYENNEYLAGKSNDCDDFYKWWENK